MGNIKELFGKNYKVLSQKSISDITGSATPVESSDYIDHYLKQKTRFLPPINFATASNFARYGSAEQYASDAISRIYQTYPYDGSLSEKIEWFNLSNFYDLYIFNHRYPRTCGYAQFSVSGTTQDGWGARDGSKVTTIFGLSDAPEYVQIKGGPHADPDSGKKLSHQFPEPWDGKANVWDNTTGINRISNLALDLDEGATVEFWIKKPGTPSSALTDIEAIFDLWNGKGDQASDAAYGRFFMGMQGATFKAEIHSGSLSSALTPDSTISTAILDGNWHHVAISVKQVQNDAGANYIEWNQFLDGQYVATFEEAEATAWGPVTGSMIANIGAFRLPATNQAEAAALIEAHAVDGYGKLSGSVDEFRYWKTARTAQEISRFWFTQIGGGTNTDAAKFSGSAQPVDLGVYYKFNEGNTGNAVADSVVLDYSGRISNGAWTGFVPGLSRVAGPTSSAMIESSASLTEFNDPIIYSGHPDVSALMTEMSASGMEWDLNNNSALYHTMPEWITSEDQDMGGDTLKKLTQIIASYLDTMHLQIQAIPTIGDIQYPYEELIVHDPNEKTEAQTQVRPYSNSPVPYAKHMVEGMGMHAPEIFVAASELAQLANRDEYREFDQKLYDIKNTIYQNIYNNLVYIYKTKGTEKSFRNLIRCFGVDDELIRINLYADNTVYRLDDANYRSTSIKSKYIDFNEPDRVQSTMYQSASEGTTNSISYIPGDNPSNASTALATGSAMTFETDVVFPLKFERTHPSNLWYDYPYLTSSLFGCHEKSTTRANEDFYWTGADITSDDKASFQIYALRPEEDSKDARFMLTSSYEGIPTLTSSEFADVYDNERWLFAVKVYPESGSLEGRHVSGSLATQIGGNHIIEFQGYNPSLDQFQNSFVLSGTLTAANGAAFMNANKRIYAGAHRQNFSGSILDYSDVKIGAVRVWDDYLSDSEIKTHAIDPTNFGRERVYKSSHLFNQSGDPNIDSIFIPQFETLLLNWDFADITGSSNGEVEPGPGSPYGGTSWDSSFPVVDASSGSDDKWDVPDKYKYHYTGRGDYFLPNELKAVDLNFLYAAKTNLPEVMSGPDTISILDVDDNYFTRDSKPINHYFAIEKSMYQTISEEMLNMFATTVEFNNIIGEPANRYRQEYKALGKLREAFFRKVTNAPDFNKFVEYYKWIDDSLTTMLMQLVPATANFSDGVKTMVESHILERNKYWTKFPTLEMKAEDPVAFVKGISELTYDWKHGHAPIPSRVPTSNSSAIAFNGVDDESQLTIADADNLSFGDASDDSAFSFAAWVKINSDWPEHFTILSKGGYEYQWKIRNSTGNTDYNYRMQLALYDLNGSNYISRKSSTENAMKDYENIWTHVCVTYNGGGDADDISMYVNGAAHSAHDITQGSYTAMHSTAYNLAIGRAYSTATNDVAKGLIDEVVIFNKVLSAPEVATLYNNGSPWDLKSSWSAQSDIVSWWRMGDSATGTSPNFTIPDQVGSNNAVMDEFEGTTTSGVVTSELPGTLMTPYNLPLFYDTSGNPLFYNTGENCLWWKERAEALVNPSTDDSVDADRNTLRRILTSDVTTNKILATGEYTDPTDYPNSGFPNAAQFNLSQDGDEYNARTQYKGSTYALRRFSKPYKLDLKTSRLLHGGTNVPMNHKGIDWTYAALRNQSSTISYWYKFDLEAAEADYNLKGDPWYSCTDNVRPIETRKIRRSGETRFANLENTPPANALKSMLIAPFQYFSQSSDIVTSVPSNGQDGTTAYFGLHDDSYGESNETPMQGPFTEAHVGGRQYRHLAGTSSFLGTSHNEKNRAEGFRIHEDGEILGGPIIDPDGGITYPWNAPALYYRDETAKRPVNIRNIRSVVWHGTIPNADAYGYNRSSETGVSTELDASAAHIFAGNYDRPRQIISVQGSGDSFYAKLSGAWAKADLTIDQLQQPVESPLISDTYDYAKLRGFGKALLLYGEMYEDMLAEYDYNVLAGTFPPFAGPEAGPPTEEGGGSDAWPYTSPHLIVERFSAPGGPETSGDSYGGFGIDESANKYSVYNALPWRNLAVRTPLDAMQTAHCAKYGALPNSTLSVGEASTALTASFHKIHRNTDYDIRQTPTLTAYRATSLLFDDDDYYKNTTVNETFTNFTVSIWYKKTGESTGFVAKLFMFGDSVNGKSLQVHVDSQERIVVQTFHGPSSTPGRSRYSPIGTIEVDKWHSIILVWDNKTLSITEDPRLYLDGNQILFTGYVDTGTDGLAPTWYNATVDEFWIGTEEANFSPVGHIQDVSLWDRALNPTEVANLYRLPGYDSAGPGDLTRIKFVTGDKRSNSLISWWKLGDSIDVITDSAPIGNGYDLVDGGGSYKAATSTTIYLPANYYATDCFETRDNWFVQHPIPANEFGYAWITASAQKEVGCDVLTTASFVTASSYASYYASSRIFGNDQLLSPAQPIYTDFAGINTQVYEPLTASSNFLGQPSFFADAAGSPDTNNYLNMDMIDSLRVPGWVPSINDALGVGATFNALMLHRNGPYGYPSWKQIRTGEHPVARNHRKHNIISVSDAPTTRTLFYGGTKQEITELKASTHSNHIESPVTIKHTPLVHRIDSLANGMPQDLAIRHSYGNNLTVFANPPLMNLITNQEQPRQLYDTLKDNYLLGEESGFANPIKAFRSLSYSETIYPKEVNTFLSKSRGRTQYAESYNTIWGTSNGNYRAFWKDNLWDRNRGDGAYNSMGFQIFNNANPENVAGAANPAKQPMWILGSGTLSMWPLDVGSGHRNWLYGLDDQYFGFPGSASWGADGVETLGPHDDTEQKGTSIPYYDEYGGTFGELQRDTIGSIFGSVTDDHLDLLGGVAAVKATARLKFSGWADPMDLRDDCGSEYGANDGFWNPPETIKLTDTDNTVVYFEVDPGSNGPHFVPTGPATIVPVTNSYADGSPHPVTQFIDSWLITSLVKHINDHAIKITAYNEDPYLILEQDVVGVLGNKTIAYGTASLWNMAADGDCNSASNQPTIFAGGRGAADGAHFLSDTYFKSHGTASLCFNHFSVAGQVHFSSYEYSEGDGWDEGWHAELYPLTVNGMGNNATKFPYRGPQPSNWKTHYWSGRNPWFDSYEAYADDIRSIAKEYTTIPEFRISEHMDFYIENGFKTNNFKFLSLEGASAPDDFGRTDFSAWENTAYYNEQFWKDYCHSDFMNHFNFIQEDHEDIASPGRISLKCSAVKKLLPYNGFYPVQRSVQLASLFSSSYAPFISGSTSAHYGKAPGQGITRDKYFAERLQSLLQPFYAPGIMYNSIKSGIAVDYPVHTSSAEIVPVTNYWDASPTPHGDVLSATGSIYAIIDTPDMRMPFEALINPDRYLPIPSPDNLDTDLLGLDSEGRMYLTAPYYGSSSFYATWSGQSKPHYSLAANNWAAEVPNFFLKSKTLSTLRSSRETDFQAFASGTTYYMDVVLRKTPDFHMNAHFRYQGLQIDKMYGSLPIYGLQPYGWGFGPRYEVYPHDHAYSVGMGGIWNAGAPAYAPSTPPYYYGTAVARLSFKPHEAVEMAEGQSMAFGLDEILANVAKSTAYFYDKNENVPLTSELEKVLTMGNMAANKSAMRVSSSINLFGTTRTPTIQYDPTTRRPIRADEQLASKSWVIHTKWECPTLNFANGMGGGLGPGESDSDMSLDGYGDWWTTHAQVDDPDAVVPMPLRRPIGIWNGYGSVPTGDSGIWFGLRESFPSQLLRGPDPSLGQVGSLLKACNFRAEQRRVGELAESKWISEAIVAIPFVDVKGRRKFFSLGNTPRQSRAIFSAALSGEDGPGLSINKMAHRMQRYIFPPHMDFLTDSGIEPYAMYIFEFHHKLSQQDLSNIWQNVMPDISVTAEKGTSVLMHETGENEFFRGNPIPKHTRWMVFKVKKKARKDYFKLTADSSDDHQFSFNFSQGGHKTIPDYSYNWPYDFFSLVELAKIDVKVGLGNDSFPMLPPRSVPDAIIGEQAYRSLAAGHMAAQAVEAEQPAAPPVPVVPASPQAMEFVGTLPAWRPGLINPVKLTNLNLGAPPPWLGKGSKQTGLYGETNPEWKTLSPGNVPIPPPLPDQEDEP